MKAISLTLLCSNLFFGCTPAETAQVADVTGPTATPEETLLDDEREQTKAAVDQALAIVEKDRQKSGISVRDPHSKAFGCVRGKFTIEKNIPFDYAAGILREEYEKDSNGRIITTYPVFPAWVRFSSANPGTPGPDNRPSGLGMAIKLMNVPGKKLLESESTAQTQDFVMVNNPVFPTANISEYLSAQRNPLLFALTHPRAGLILAGLLRKKNADPAEVRYWSMTAFRYEERGMKYSAVPCAEPQTPMPENPSETYLRDNLESHLKTRSACFNFMVQIYISPELTPIEDPTIEWKESDSPFVKVATLDIPIQEFRSSKQQEFCENLSFTPWHSIQDFRPIGNLNRVRKRVYEAVAAQRRKNNGVQAKEPTPDDNFQF
ncbi:MAG: hypothetical protein RIR26_1236 [Pseudomonadota bacterium]|jgi:hypothetical protein